MGGDELIAALTDGAFEAAHGEEVRAAEKARCTSPRCDRSGNCYG
jgi:hypothetical protein